MESDYESICKARNVTEGLEKKSSLLGGSRHVDG